MGIKIINVSEFKYISLKQALIRDAIPIAINLTSATIFIIRTLSNTLSEDTTNTIYLALSLAVFGRFILEILTLLTNKGSPEQALDYVDCRSGSGVFKSPKNAFFM